MDHQIAYAVLDDRLKILRQRTFQELVALIGRPDTNTAVGEDGKTYQLETQVFWDRKKGGDIHVIVAVDDGGWSAFKPLSAGFMMAPDGTFVGKGTPL
ncbi:conserved hypothetical protein [Candidatus Sulfotelmatobacter sp. SbA7]|nr:conserved hypothetical protein [Candidatus Sulfotelmatobacter sp. SbA7]